MVDLGRAQRRFVMALSVSLALHAWLMQNHYGKGAARERITVVAQLLPAATETKVETPPPLMPVPHVTEAAPPQPSTAQGSTAPAAMTAVPPVTTAAAVLSQPADPNYYAVGDLDVFPKALVKPDLSAALAANQEPTAGKVRATLLIDEAGVVNAVRNVKVSASNPESVTLEWLLRTRFTPARNKNGRIVKAQVLVALDYDTRSAVASR